MNNVCNNCGKSGHISNLCKLPIVSYGIVAFRICDGKPEYLMIRRKDTFGYIDFIRGKYSGFDHLQEKASDILAILPPEKNNTVSKMKELGFEADNSLDSQALLEIYNEFCLSKKCLNCTIGMKIINS